MSSPTAYITLVWHPTARPVLTEIHEDNRPTLQEMPVGTYARFGTEKYSPWKKRVKRRVSGRTWKQVLIRDLPHQIKAQAILLNIQIEEFVWAVPEPDDLMTQALPRGWFVNVSQVTSETLPNPP